MKTEVKKSSLAMLVMQRNLLFCICIFLLFITLSLTVVATRKESITFFKSPETKLDLQGAQSQGEFLAHLILNRDALSASEQNRSLLQWIDPAFTFKLFEGLKHQQQEIENNRASFEWTLIHGTLEPLDSSNVRIFLSGSLAVYLPIQAGKKQLIEQEKSTYILDLTLKNGKLLLKSFRKGEKDD